MHSSIRNARKQWTIVQAGSFLCSSRLRRVKKRKPRRKCMKNRNVNVCCENVNRGWLRRTGNFVRNDKSHRQRLPRRAQKLRPPRNDRIDRLDRKHGTQNPIFGFRKTSLICCLILTVPDFFDSLKRPRGSDESRGRCYLRGKSHSADFQFETGFQPIFHATMESPYLIIF